MDTHCDCIDCRIVRGEFIPTGGIIYKDERWVLNHGENKILGHLILKPIRHHYSIAEFDNTLARELGGLLKWINAAVLDVCKPVRIYSASFGDRFPYVHFHIIPRYPDMPGWASTVFTNFDNGVYNCTVDEVEKVVSDIRIWLEANRHKYNSDGPDAG